MSDEEEYYDDDDYIYLDEGPYAEAVSRCHAANLVIFCLMSFRMT